MISLDHERDHRSRTNHVVLDRFQFESSDCGRIGWALRGFRPRSLGRLAVGQGSVGPSGRVRESLQPLRPRYALFFLKTV